MCSLPSLSIFPFFLPIDGIQAFPDIINAVCLNDVYNLFNWDHGKLKWKFCTAPFTQSTEWWHFTELHWQLKCVKEVKIWMPGYLIRAEVMSQKSGLVTTQPRAVSKCCVQIPCHYVQTLKRSKCWKSPSPSYYLKHSVVRELIYAFLIKSHLCHIADIQGQKLKSHLFMPSQHTSWVRWSQTHISHSLIFGASGFWYLSALS